jgi:exo-beta-1,3-glucanase (GH17 family)
VTDPVLAARWTAQRYEDLTARTDKVVVFKEVGWPTAGHADSDEHAQSEYYRALSRTPVRFAWFEAYDQAWKTHTEVEPHWGLFRSDRTPKEVVGHVCQNRRQ